jgi:hypothetical protein
MPVINGFNYVAVTGNLITQAGAPSSGSLLFQASDIVWDTASSFVASLDPVGLTLPGSGLIQGVNLLAQDNAGLSASWYWVLTLSLNGVTYPKRKVPVLFSNGDPQDITKLLDISTVLGG